jgi:hypothetical protein
VASAAATAPCAARCRGGSSRVRGQLRRRKQRSEQLRQGRALRRRHRRDVEGRRLVRRGSFDDGQPLFERRDRPGALGRRERDGHVQRGHDVHRRHHRNGHRECRRATELPGDERSYGVVLGPRDGHRWRGNGRGDDGVLHHRRGQLQLHRLRVRNVHRRDGHLHRVRDSVRDHSGHGRQHRRHRRRRLLRPGQHAAPPVDDERDGADRRVRGDQAVGPPRRAKRRSGTTLPEQPCVLQQRVRAGDGHLRRGSLHGPVRSHDVRLLRRRHHLRRSGLRQQLPGDVLRVEHLHLLVRPALHPLRRLREPVCIPTGVSYGITHVCGYAMQDYDGSFVDDDAASEQ